jgi:hypothetical protein
MAAKTTGTKTTTKRPSKRPPATNLETHGPSMEEIALRAFELFLARGGEHGHHEEDWLKAERELRERYSIS